MNQLQATSMIERELDAVFTREVIKMPLQGPEGIPTPHYGLCFDDASSREDWMRTTVKKGYIAHTNQDVKDLCSVVLAGFDVPESDVSIKARFVPQRGHAVAIMPTKEHRRRVAGSDTLWPSLYVRAYYGGSFRATVAMKRDACSNLMMMRKVSGTTVNLRHQGNYRENFDTTLNEFRGLIEKFDDIVVAAQMLHEHHLRADDFFDQLYAGHRLTATQTRKLNSKIASMKARIEKERIETGVSHGANISLWEAVNAVTGFVQHDKVRHGNPTFADRAFQGMEDNESEAAWNLAFSIAS